MQNLLCIGYEKILLLNPVIFRGDYPTIGKSVGKPRLMGYQLKTPYRDGTTHVLFEPLDFIAALAPKPRVNLTRCPGVFAANSKH